MPRGMDTVAGRVKDPGAVLVAVVDGARDQLLVARDRRRREDDGVTRLQLHLRMLLGRDPSQRGKGLTLATARQDDEPLIRLLVDVLDLDQDVTGHLDVAQL